MTGKKISQLDIANLSDDDQLVVVDNGSTHRTTVQALRGHMASSGLLSTTAAVTSAPSDNDVVVMTGDNTTRGARLQDVKSYMGLDKLAPFITRRLSEGGCRVKTNIRPGDVYETFILEVIGHAANPGRIINVTLVGWVRSSGLLFCRAMGNSLDQWDRGVIDLFIDAEGLLAFEWSRPGYGNWTYQVKVTSAPSFQFAGAAINKVTEVVGQGDVSGPDLHTVSVNVDKTAYFGTTLQTVTSSRRLNATYYNSTTKIMTVRWDIYRPNSAVRVRIAGREVIRESSSITTGYLNFIVLPGQSYYVRAERSSGCFVSYWEELV